MITAYIDGGARGNPGPAGYGVYIELPDGAVEELHGGLGIATNNVAEYNGLLAALQWAVEHGHRQVSIKADSELLVKQMRGEYKIKNAGLQPLAARARQLVARLKDSDSFVQRRAAESLLRTGITPATSARAPISAVTDVFPLLASQDPYLRYSARTTTTTSPSQT